MQHRTNFEANMGRSRVEAWMLADQAPQNATEPHSFL